MWPWHDKDMSTPDLMINDHHHHHHHNQWLSIIIIIIIINIIIINWHSLGCLNKDLLSWEIWITWMSILFVLSLTILCLCASWPLKYELWIVWTSLKDLQLPLICQMVLEHFALLWAGLTFCFAMSLCCILGWNDVIFERRITRTEIIWHSLIGLMAYRLHKLVMGYLAPGYIAIAYIARNLWLYSQ